MKSALVTALGIVLLSSGCVKHVTRSQGPELASVDRSAPYIKAHMRDGGLYILARWKVEPAGLYLVGDGQQFDPTRGTSRRGWFTVPLSEVALFETNVVQNSASVAGLAVITGASAALTVFCLTNTKACFGSCPTFYAPDGDGGPPVLQAEGFSDSVTPALARRDVDALFRTRPAARALQVRMTNEALETHVIKEANILAVPAPPGGRVFAAGDDSFWQAPAVARPTGCAAPEGDCLPAVMAVDGTERFSPASDRDLAEREVIELRFAAAPGPHGLVLAVRQTLLSTYVLYQGLAFMGRSAGQWLATVERSADAIDRRRSVVHVLGGIEVLVADAAGAWRVAGEVNETGPLAMDVHLVPLPAGARTDRIRLRMARGHWRLDHVALATLGARVAPVRVAARVGEGRLGRAFGGERQPATAFPIVTLPGDAYLLDYQLPEHPAGYELFLESRGYYLEWMRKEWLDEENPLRALQMVVDPRGALRALAPEFKRHEADLEQAFWRSRYASP
jgi:hypothetical protein